MSARKPLPLFWIAAAILVALGIAAALYPSAESRQAAGAATVRVAQLSAQAAAGQRAFDAVCAACHGQNASGTDKGPPLVHDIYNPGHHGDESFLRAVRVGSQQHHWHFGDMPAQPSVSDQQGRDIVRYVRELQGANGIRTQPHRM